MSPSSASVTLIWHESREFDLTACTKSSMPVSISLIGPTRSTQALSIYTWHVAQAQAPPQSASIPAIPFLTAACMRLSPLLASMLPVVWSTATKVILGKCCPRLNRDLLH